MSVPCHYLVMLIFDKIRYPIHLNFCLPFVLLPVTYQFVIFVVHHSSVISATLACPIPFTSSDFKKKISKFFHFWFYFYNFHSISSPDIHHWSEHRICCFYFTFFSFLFVSDHVLRATELHTYKIHVNLPGGHQLQYGVPKLNMSGSILKSPKYVSKNLEHDW